VKFVSRGPGYTLFLTPGEAVLALKKSREQEQAASSRRDSASHPQGKTFVRLQLVGANPQSAVTGLEPLPSRVNYFLGSDPKQWRTNVPTYSRVKYESVYPGIDLIFYGNQQQLEYDLIVAPGADPDIITLGFESGAEALEIDGNGDLSLQTANGRIRQKKPFIYQEALGSRKTIAGGYLLRGKHQVGFQVGHYDMTRPLVIDPVLSYSTYLGGTSKDEARGIAVDLAGDVYVTGFTSSFDFPTTTNVLQAQESGGVDFDAFVTKLNADGSGLVYSTYLGGLSNDEANDIAVDSSGRAYVTGITDGGFPILNPVQIFGGATDVFVAKLSSNGSALLYSTYLGGSGFDGGNDIAVDASSGKAYVTGETVSEDYPTSANAFRRNKRPLSDVFVTELNANGSLGYSTFLGGNGDDVGRGIALDSSSKAYVTGQTNSTNLPQPPCPFLQTCVTFERHYQGGPADAFVAVFDPAEEGNQSLDSLNYLGGSGTDIGNAITVDSGGRAHVTGVTGSSDFPLKSAVDTSNQVNEAFVAKLNATASGLVYSTFLGGSGTEVGRGIVMDANSSTAWVTGSTTSADFPITGNPFQSNLAGIDVFVTQISVAGALLFSTFLGGSDPDDGVDITADLNGNLYVTGRTASTDFPIAGTPFQSVLAGTGEVLNPVDAFVAKIFDTEPARKPGLSGVWQTLIQDCPDKEKELKCTLEGDMLVFNPGTATAARSVLKFFLSGDAIWDDGDSLLDEVKVKRLDPGESDLIHLRAKLPKDQNASGDFVIAVLDAFNNVPEANEENNVLVSPRIP
jgi:Beta-propeller repeat/CARDB